MIKTFFRKFKYPSIIILLFLLVCSISIFFFLDNRWITSCLQSYNLKEKALTSTDNKSSIPETDLPLETAQKHTSLHENASLLLGHLLSPGSLLLLWGKGELSKPCLRSSVLQETLLSLSEAEGSEFERLPDIGKQPPSLIYVSLAPQANFSASGNINVFPNSLSGKKTLQTRAQRGKKSPYPAYCFPVSDPFSFRDTWGDPRGSERYHEGTDIFAPEGTEVYAVTDGVIHKLVTWNRAGHTLLLQGRDGKGYCYMHLQKYAEGITEGKVVKKGELIAYVGCSGLRFSNAHLHFQVHADHQFSRDGTMNPYGFLVSLSQGRGVADLGRPKTFSGKLAAKYKLVRYRETSKRAYFTVFNKPLVTWVKPDKSVPPANWEPQPNLHPHRKLFTVLEGR